MTGSRKNKNGSGRKNRQGQKARTRSRRASQRRRRREQRLADPDGLSPDDRRRLNKPTLVIQGGQRVSATATPKGIEVYFDTLKFLQDLIDQLPDRSWNARSLELFYRGQTIIGIDFTTADPRMCASRSTVHSELSDLLRLAKQARLFCIDFSRVVVSLVPAEQVNCAAAQFETSRDFRPPARHCPGRPSGQADYRDSEHLSQVKWPFDSLWIVPEGPAPLMPQKLPGAFGYDDRTYVDGKCEGFYRSWHDDEGRKIRIDGLLLTQNGAMAVFAPSEVTEKEVADGLKHMEGFIQNPAVARKILASHSYDWVPPRFLDPLIEHINSHVNACVPTLMPRHKVRQLVRRGVVPKPYYRVQLRKTASLVRPRNDSPTPREFSHRFPRRGHNVLLKKRGMLPLEDAQRRVFDARGYHLYENGEPTNLYLGDMLAQRCIEQCRLGEWLAIKVIWRRQTVVGDESLPFVPSIRVTERS